MKVLITGGTGYLGRAAVRAFHARGHELVVFARSATRSGLPGTLVDGDVRDCAALERAAAGCDAISHSAALVRGRIGGRYALGGENASQRRVFEIVREVTGRRVPLRIPFPLATLLGAAEELRVFLVGGTPLITRGAVEIFRHDWSLDSGE